eukprot:TRINITY_DN7695_c0_g1_i4.p1 TRINITY_DN7695_c0_g1~~TRINITY_DN7695_c0_g1_i4.p1  ORF type:complete len:106 (-),score=30.15 TRINITY_DN7695_c0_g1_i4:513-830(-)
MPGPDVAGSMFEEIKDQVLDNDSNTVGIVVGLLVGLLCLIFFIWTRRKSLGRDVLICGPCDSGKTTLLLQLVMGMGKPPWSTTSSPCRLRADPALTWLMSLVMRE